MHRNSFLKLALTAAAGIALPIKMLARQAKATAKPFVVRAGKDRFNKSLSLFDGDTFHTKVSPKDSNGGIYMWESVREKPGGPTYHYHFDQDEWWYVLKGNFIFKVGDVMYELKEGDSLFGPRGVPHAFAKIGEGEARLLMFFQPAGKMEEFFQAVAAGKLKGLSPEQHQEIRKAHGFISVGPPINQLKL